MAANKRNARHKKFMDALTGIKAKFFVSVESFRLMQAGWELGRQTEQLGIRTYALDASATVPAFWVQLFENAQGCLVAFLSTGECFYAVSCH